VTKVSLASRLTWLAAVAVGVAVAVTSLAAYFTVRSQMMNDLDSNLLKRAYDARHTTPNLLATVPPAAMGAADIKLAFVSNDGEPPICACTPDTSPPIGPPELAVARGAAATSLRTVESHGVDLRVVAVRMPRPYGRYALVVAQSLQPTENTLNRLGLVLGVVGGLGVIGAALAGWAVARSGLRPVRRFTEAVEDIARTERLEPIAITGDDEIARLSSAFNAMVAALAASQTRQRTLVADAGHELRTPLTSLRTNLDLLRQADREGGLPDQARTELLTDVRAQIEELSTLVGDLVELARDEPLSRAVESTDLAEITARAVQRVRRRAPGINFDVQLQSWYVEGEPQGLERAVTNLLDNAVKWSPANGTITVTLSEGGLTVTDQGPGISDQDLPHVFERFYRSTEARTTPGSGLGLAIVRQAAERHGGQVAVGHSAGGGAEFWFGIPGSATP
jgi:two-component system sensor histidine kinase MprB